MCWIIPNKKHITINEKRRRVKLYCLKLGRYDNIDPTRH